MNSVPRILKHLGTTHWRLSRAFPKPVLMAIRKAIEATEAKHNGHIRFAVETALHGMPAFHGQSSQERAVEVFSSLRVWDTELNNGVLIYVLLADRAVEIVADRGINSRVGKDEWQVICRRMEEFFKRREYEAGSIYGITAVAQRLTAHFPDSTPEQPNSLETVTLL